MYKKEEILLNIKRTRWAFIPEYSCTIILLSVLVYSKWNKIILPRQFTYLILLLTVVIISSIEFIRSNHRAKITGSKVLIIDGLFKQTKKHIWISAITDIDMYQNYLHRLFGYGNIHIRSASGDQALQLKDINNPEQIMEKLEELIEKYKNTQK